MPDGTTERELTAGLWMLTDSDRVSLSAHRASRRALLAQVVFEEGRARVLLSMLGGHRLLDVSLQPGSVARVIASEAVASRRDGNAWCSAVEAALAREAGRRVLWRRSQAAPRGLVPLLTGLSFPMLAAAYDAGASELPEVPRWAGHVLERSSAREAAISAFGTRATRRTTRALATSLLPPAGADGAASGAGGAGGAGGGGGGGGAGGAGGATVRLAPLCLALMGRSALEPDQIVEVLAADVPWQPPPVRLAASQVEAARQVLHDLGPATATRLLLDAAGRPHGIDLLLETLGAYGSMRHHFPGIPPARLDTLRQACRDLAPGPRPRLPGTAAEQRHPRPAVAGAGSATDMRADPVEPGDVFVPRLAPPAPATRRARTFRYPDPVRGLETAPAGDLRLLLPHTPADLTAWGRRLGNCLHSYAPAVAAGHSWVIGVEDSGRLTACVEVDPATRTVRQFLAARNRRPAATLVAATVGLLRSRGVIRTAEGP